MNFMSQGSLYIWHRQSGVFLQRRNKNPAYLRNEGERAGIFEELPSAEADIFLRAVLLCAGLLSIFMKG